jgi:GNAT superfamily N-acetyltransferase
MIHIRQVEPVDVAGMVPAARSFFRENQLPGEFNAETFTLGWMGLIKAGCGFAFTLVDERGDIKGGIGAVVNTDLNTGDKIAVEMFYYAMPEVRGNGLRLLPIIEDAARARGCKRFWMIHLEDGRSERMERFYGKRGYELKEHLYMKDLRQ